MPSAFYTKRTSRVPVSYTHLDVYKRQNKECEATMFYEMGTRSSTQVMKDIFEKKIGGNVWRFLFYKRIIDEYKISFPNLKMSEDMIFIMDYLNACKSVNVISDKCYVYNPVSYTHLF